MPYTLLETRRIAMDLLSRREHSCLELQCKLQAYGCSLTIIESVLKQLELDELLSNERFAQAYVRMRHRRGFGPLRLQQELRERGIDIELIQQVIYSANIDWAKAAKQAYTKKYGQKAAIDYVTRAKQARFLAYRGFNHEQINYALDTHI